MGTRNNPGAFDCHAKADPDEPLFTLLARDALAPSLVTIWARMRGGDPLGALATFSAMVSNYWPNPEHIEHDRPKVREAEDCAEAMRGWTPSVEIQELAFWLAPPAAPDRYTNAAKAGWAAFFDGKGPTEHRFPLSRTDLHDQFADGHKWAREFAEGREQP